MKYRKKPVVIEAWQFDPLAFDHPSWVEPAWWSEEILNNLSPTGRVMSQVRGETVLVIPNEHGPVKARLGDWVIKGVNGEIYPCTDDVFQKTYERVEE